MRTFAILIFTVAVLGCDNRTVNDFGGPSPPTPVILSFTADATRLNAPTLDTFLRWSVTGTADTRCRIESPGLASQNIGDVPLGGFVQVRPGISRDYVLSCSNRGGTVVRLVSIVVG